MTEETKKPEEVKEVVETTAEVDTPTPAVEEVKVDAIEKEAIEKTDEEAQKEMRKLLSDNEGATLAEAAVQNNQLEFELDGVLYRVRKTNFIEKQEANKFRMKKFVELLKDKDTLLERDLKKLYKDKGIDVDSIDKQILELDSQQKALLLDLGKAIKENRSKPELEKYKEEIINISHSIQGLQQEKQQLLEYSLENRILMEVYSYMIWMVAEKKVGEKWTRIWKTHQDFLSSDNVKLLGEITKLGAIVITEDMSSNVRM